MATYVQRHIFFIYAVVGLISPFVYLSANPLVMEFAVQSWDEHCHTLLQENIPSPCIVEAVSFQADIVVDEDELRYLFGVQEGVLVTADDIQRGCLYLQKKQKFQSIKLTITQGIQGIILDVFLEAYWTLSKVCIQGLLFGKDTYKQYYLLEPGEFFAIQKHHDSCKKIEDVLHEKGYLDGAVIDHLSYDRSLKTVTATLIIDCGSRFVIDDVRVVRKDRPADDDDSAVVFRDVQASLTKRLQGNYFSQELITQETVRVKRMLTKHGFMNASIHMQKAIDRATKKMLLQFFVTLDTKKEFVFFGNHFFSHEQLLDMVLAFGRSAWIIPMEIIAQEIEKQYYDAGFWDIKIECRQDGSRFFFVIAEGVRALLKQALHDEDPQYFVHDVAIEGFPELRRLGPFAAISHETPQLFNEQLLGMQRAWLVGYLRNLGYVYAQVFPELVYDGCVMNIIWHVKQGEQIKFGKTVMRGIAPFPFKYLLASADYKERDVWNIERIERTLLSLRDVGIFEAMHVVPDATNNVGTERPVILNLVADDLFEVRLRAGFQQVSKNLGIKTGSTYKLGGSFAWKNPTHVADQFYFNADATKFYRDVVAAYHRPWVLNIPLHLLVKGYTHKYIQPVFIGSDKPLYTALQHGFLCGIRRHVDAFDVGCTAGFEVMKTTGLSHELARAIDFTPELIGKGVPYFFLEPSVFIDMLDNDLNPAQGWYSAFSCKGMFPFKEQSTLFFKMLLEYACFFPVRSAVCAVRVRAGHIFKERFSHVMPSERFYLGGENSLRSIYKDMAPPLGEYCTPKGCILVPQGGRSLANANIEFRIPLVHDIGLVLFQDLGVLAQNSWSEVTGGKLLSATGFGLRYHTPVGPLRFDLGWRWRRQNPQESLYAWFLTLGNAF